MKIKKLYFFYGGAVAKNENKKNTMRSLQNGAHFLGIPTESCDTAMEFGRNNKNDYSRTNEYGVRLGYLPSKDRFIEKNFQNNLFFVDRNILKDYQTDASILKQKYFRISLGSIYHELSKKINIPNDILKIKQKKFYENFDINLKQNKKPIKSAKILLLLNKPHGFGTNDINGNSIGWGLNKIKELRSNGFNNRIDMRFHPATYTGVKQKTVSKADHAYKNVYLSNNNIALNSILKDEYLCVIGYNTSAIVPFFIEGVPIWVDCKTNILYKYSNIYNISDINKLKVNINNKQKFLDECINILWTTEQMSQGLLWKSYLAN